MTIDDDYASGQLSVTGSGVSSTPVSFNLSGDNSATFNVKSTGLTTVTTIGASPAPSTYGELVTFTVSVDNTSGTGAVPTGSVEFFDGTTDLGPGTALGAAERRPLRHSPSRPCRPEPNRSSLCTRQRACMATAQAC